MTAASPKSGRPAQGPARAHPTAAAASIPITAAKSRQQNDIRSRHEASPRGRGRASSEPRRSIPDTLLKLARRAPLIRAPQRRRNADAWRAGTPSRTSRIRAVRGNSTSSRTSRASRARTARWAPRSCSTHWPPADQTPQSWHESGLEYSTPPPRAVVLGRTARLPKNGPDHPTIRIVS